MESVRNVPAACRLNDVNAVDIAIAVDVIPDVRATLACVGVKVMIEIFAEDHADDLFLAVAITAASPVVEGRIGAWMKVCRGPVLKVGVPIEK